MILMDYNDGNFFASNKTEPISEIFRDFKCGINF